MSAIVQLDAVIVGGGIAGLWIANRLKVQGRSVALLEADSLGCAQTLASQGMIHGGLKYALGGRLTDASEAIAGMPDRWRACLNGTGELNLRNLKPLSGHNLLFADGSGLGRFSTFFASRALRGRIERLPETQWPAALEGCGGWVYALNDLVVDVPALIDVLAAGLRGQVFGHRLQASEVHRDSEGWQLFPGNTSIRCQELILCAGGGNEALLDGLGLSAPAMQRRALRQIIVRHPALTPLYGHCLTGLRSLEPRISISSHPDGDRWLWYLGGQIAGAAADLSEGEVLDRARTTLSDCLPWLDLQDAELAVLDVDRAEAASSGQRPETAFVQRASDSEVAQSQSDRAVHRTHTGPIVCWPTKLTLAPAAADQVLDLISIADPDLEPRQSASAPSIPLPNARSGHLPWAS